MESRILDIHSANSHAASVLLDTSILIYYLEAVGPYNLLIEEIFQDIVDENIRGFLSVISITEFVAKPLEDEKVTDTVTVDNLRYSQATRNELLARLLSEVTLDDDTRKQVVRRHFLERRGEGVGIILNESEELSGKTPIYEVFDEELRLTIFASRSIWETP